jgi:hypothetical protein
MKQIYWIMINAAFISVGTLWYIYIYIARAFSKAKNRTSACFHPEGEAQRD